jgi:hypothetical protein
MMNEIAYRESTANAVRGAQGQDTVPAPGGAALTEDVAQRLLAELRRDMNQQIDWQVQQQLTTRRGPSLGEATLALGSLCIGAVVTGILVANATTVTSGLLGTQTATHQNTLPFVVVVWVALFLVNVAWARRR